MKERVQKIISNCGICSRRKAETLIEEGKVKVNGKIIILGDKADIKKDKILVNGKPVRTTKNIYIMFNKPKHCLTTLKEKNSPYKTIMNYIKLKERIYPVGRLDYNTEGLLLLTNNGEFANSIMHPSNEVKKTYKVDLRQDFEEKDKFSLENGITIDKKKTAPAKVKIIKEKTVEITIHEGRNRIVRRMFEKLRYNITKLTRIKIGSLTLGDLQKGRYRKLSKKELEKLYK